MRAILVSTKNAGSKASLCLTSLQIYLSSKMKSIIRASDNLWHHSKKNGDNSNIYI